MCLIHMSNRSTTVRGVHRPQVIVILASHVSTENLSSMHNTTTNNAIFHCTTPTLSALSSRAQEKTLYDEFSSNVTFEDGRYKVSKEFHEPLLDNYQLSVKRLRGLLHRLNQDPAILKEYDSTIKYQLKKGIIEVVPMEEPRSNQVHYLPHHAVVRRDKTTTKLPIVYDASAK